MTGGRKEETHHCFLRQREKKRCRLDDRFNERRERVVPRRKLHRVGEGQMSAFQIVTTRKVKGERQKGEEEEGEGRPLPPPYAAKGKKDQGDLS